MARRGWLTGAAERFQSVDFRFGFACEYEIFVQILLFAAPCTEHILKFH